MTDARFPERWLNDKRVVRLGASAFRTFVTTLTWSVANRTDGIVELDDLDLIHGADSGDVPALVRSGLWSTADGAAFLIAVFAETQTSRGELERLDNLRRREREKKARQRAKESPAAESPGTVPGDVPRDAVPRDRIGQDRQDRQAGQAREVSGLQVVPPHESPDGWPPVICTTTGHSGCGWQHTGECSDCVRREAS